MFKIVTIHFKSILCFRS